LTHQTGCQINPPKVHGYVDSVKLGDITVETFNFSEDIQQIKQKS